MKDLPLVTAVILNWNGKDIVASCVNSVLNSDYPNKEVVVVDNISTDDSVELLNHKFAGDKRLKVVITETNLPPVKANNLGIKNAKGDYIFLLNNDTEVERSCIRNLVLAAIDDTVCSPKVLLKSGKIDFNGGMMDRLGYGWGRGYGEDDLGQYDDQGFFYPGFFLFKKSMLERTGFFDEEICFGWDDLDFSWRIRLAGYKINLVPTAIIYHLGSHTLKRLRTKYFNHYNMRKNRIAGLIKNYNFYNLLRFLPILLMFYFLIFLQELFIERDLRLAFTSISAILWNIKVFPLLMKKRHFTQKNIRRVGDREIIKYMTNKSVLFEYFLKPRLGRILKPRFL